MTEPLNPVAQGIVDMVVKPTPFGDQDRAMLELERLRFLTVGAKHDEILARFAMTPVRYYIRLNWILNQPEATAYDPDLVGHLIALRDKRRDVRTRGTVAAGVPTRPDTRGVRPTLLEVTP